MGLILSVWLVIFGLGESDEIMRLDQAGAASTWRLWDCLLLKRSVLIIRDTTIKREKRKRKQRARKWSSDGVVSFAESFV